MSRKRQQPGRVGDSGGTDCGSGTRTLRRRVRLPWLGLLVAHRRKDREYDRTHDEDKEKQGCV